MSSTPTRRKIVLVVDDESLVRMVTAEIVELAGFDVLEAVDADNAVAILEARSDIALVVTDVDMPGSMDGLKLAHAVRDRWPPIKLIIVSGKARPAELNLPVGARFLGKPYSVDMIIATLSSLMVAEL